MQTKDSFLNSMKDNTEEVAQVLDRLRLYLELNDMGNNDFARKINLSSGGASQIFGAKKGFRLDTLLRILNTFPELEADWLLKGEGDTPINQEVIQYVKSEGKSQANIQGINMQTNHTGESQNEDEENSQAMIEILKKQLDEKNQLIQEQKEELKEQREAIKAKDERITQLTDKLISS